MKHYPLKNEINKFLFLIFWFSSSFVMAQDYQAVKSDRIAFFENEYGGIKCIRIDSIEFLTDSVFYPFSNILQNEDGCFTPYAGSWIGYKIITQSNGVTIFLNHEHDSVKIKTNSILNESWTSYVFPDSSIVMATLINLDTLTLFGQLDSAKTIGFQVYNKNLNPVNHNLNTLSIILSKNFGLVKTLNFSYFPDFETNYIDGGQYRECYLRGLSNPKLGIQNLGWYDVNDFQVGDEIHVGYEWSLWFVPESVSSDSKKTIYKYLERRDYEDSIVYKVEIIQSLRKTRGVSVSNSYLHDTIQTIFKPNPMFDKLPGEIIFYDNRIKYYSMNFNPFLSKTEPSLENTFYHADDSCYSNCCWDGCIPDYTYFKGLGGPYYECSNFDSGGGVENKLVYYKKGNVTWGTPLVITSVQENCVDEEIEIYPNPAKNFISISIQNQVFPLNLEISDIEGKVVSANKIISVSTRVNIETLKPGIYFYRFSKIDEVIKTGKLIVE